MLSYRGPLFIVGMPRSGTKLLRGIINGHPCVSIPEIETEFLPYWVKKWETFGDISDEHQFQQFYRSCQGLPFFVYLKDANKHIDVKSWYKQCRNFGPAGVFEALVRTYLGLTDDDAVIWGDKSPSYLTHLQLLKQLYPQARFIHIIRDVRDHCLSINKAWGKNVLRAAQRWSDDVAVSRTIGSTFGDNYLEIRYEDLLDDTAEIVGQVCHHLGISYHDELLDFPGSTENLGGAKGKRGIVGDNIGKYKIAFDSRTIMKIEIIAGKTLTASGYDCDYSDEPIRLGPLRLRYFQILDGVNLFIFSAKERGFIAALRFVIRYFAVSGNRQNPSL
jgi:hypothetical protein